MTELLILFIGFVRTESFRTFLFVNKVAINLKRENKIGKNSNLNFFLTFVEHIKS